MGSHILFDSCQVADTTFAPWLHADVGQGGKSRKKFPVATVASVMLHSAGLAGRNAEDHITITILHQANGDSQS